MNNEILKSGTPFYCDLYHLTMAQSWFADGRHEQPKTSEAFFRRCPFKGGYLLSAGLGEFLQWAEKWEVKPEDIDYLASLEGANGKPLFRRDFLDYLQGQKLRVNMQAVPEGEIVFPNEPVLSVSGPCWQVDMAEAAFLNIFNAQSLIATKAARMVQAAQADGVKRPVLEFGLRRAQDLGCFLPTRAAYIGGCAGTSNVEAARYYGIPPKGTMAHSFVMSYETELEAFKAYMKGAEGNTTLLIDTYDTREGAKNAVRASRETGIPLMGARIDSGDLAYWSHEVRKIFDEAGFPDAKLVASNDLDEHLIENLVMVQKADYDIYAAGTKLVTAYDTPALGGVFKTKSFMGEPKIKIAEGKTTIPGATNVLRIVRNGMFEGDIIVPAGEHILQNGRLPEKIVSFNLHNTEGKKIEFAAGEEAYQLLKPVMEAGRLVSTDKERPLTEIRAVAQENLGRLDPAYKRLVNPHIYGVGLKQDLHQLQQNLILAHRAKQQRTA